LAIGIYPLNSRVGFEAVKGAGGEYIRAISFFQKPRAMTRLVRLELSFPRSNGLQSNVSERLLREVELSLPVRS
jgi:hypothetical protein